MKAHTQSMSPRRPRRSLAEVRSDYWHPCDPDQVSWPHVGLGAALGAFCLPWVGVVIAIVVCLVTDPIAIGEVLGYGFFGSLIGGAMLCCYVGFVALPVLPVVYLAAMLIRLRVRETPMACFTGGLLALVSSLPLWVTAPDPALIPLTIGLAVATLAGQVGSGYAAMLYELSASGVWERKRQGNREEATSRFTLRQIMGVMVVASVLLAVLRACDLLTTRVGALLAGWATVQLGTLQVAVAIVDARWMRLAKRPPLWRARQKRTDSGAPSQHWDQRTLTGWESRATDEEAPASSPGGRTPDRST